MLGTMVGCFYLLTCLRIFELMMLDVEYVLEICWYKSITNNSSYYSVNHNSHSLVIIITENTTQFAVFLPHLHEWMIISLGFISVELCQAEKCGYSHKL